MVALRLTLLIAIAGGLAIFLLQNWDPALPLVFLGIRSLALPLSLWMLAAIVAGAVTAALINVLFKFSGYWALRRGTTTATVDDRPLSDVSADQSTTPRQRYQDPYQDTVSSDRTRYGESSSDRPKNQTVEEDSDFDFEEDEAAATPPQPSASSRQNRPTSSNQEDRSYETRQQPKSGYRSGSVYSYSYREQENPAVGRFESIYDAEYRVIIPPHSNPPSNETVESLPRRQAQEDWEDDWENTQTDEDDWGFEDEFNSEDNWEQNPRR